MQRMSSAAKWVRPALVGGRGPAAVQLTRSG